MPLDGAEFAPEMQAALQAAGRAAALSVEVERLDAGARISRVARHPLSGRLALVSSFGTESIVLLHLVATHAPECPVLFLETGMHFPETLAYQREVASALGLKHLRIVRPVPEAVTVADPTGTLHTSDADACCALRKVAPLGAALDGYAGWITGRKRYQSRGRNALPLVEADGHRLKLNPLADWSSGDVRAYMDRFDLPRHPLVARGYPSIGCAPCTSKPVAGGDARSGRWAGRDKQECGIHFENGRVVRSPQGAQSWA